MIKKITICCLAFLMLMSSIQPVFAQESSRSTDTETATQRSPEQLSSDQITETPDAEMTLNKAVQPQTDITQTEIIQEPDLDLLDAAINSSANTSATLENTPAEETVEPPSEDIQLAAITKNKEDRQPLKGKNFKLQADTSTGALTMEYQIEVPPGRNGIQPDLALVYNSQNTDNDNIFGYGWSINIPYIERVNKKGVEKLYSENFFNSSLSGELKDITLTDGTHGIYGAKIENEEFLKYEYKNNNSWEVSDKNGMVYKFGLTAQSRQDNPNDNAKIYKWMLEEIRDPNDNYIKYEYLKEEGQIYPSKIKYTGYGNIDGIFSMEFIKKDRNDKNISYKSGFKINTKYLISSIKKNYNDTSNQQYNLEYQNGDNGKRSILINITEQGNETAWLNTKLPPDKFDYQKNTGTWTKNSNYTVPVDLYNNYNEASGARIFDVNGDALPDIVFAKKGQSPAVYINKGDDTGWQQNFSYSVPVYFVDKYGEDLGVRIGDVNGDHLEDLLEAYSYVTSSGVVATNWGKVYINQGNDKGWNLDLNYDFPDSLSFVSQYNVDTGVRVADANGDGLVDIIGTQSADIYLNKGDGTGWIAGNNGIYTKPPEGSTLADVNGDGLVDSISAQASQIVNGQPAGPKGVYINTGKDWQVDSQYSIPVYFADKYSGDLGVRMDDANGDGLLDIFHANGADSLDKWKVYINKGDGTGWEADAQYVIPEAFISGKDNGVRLADVNGDGLADFVSRYGGLNNKGSVYTYPGKISDLLNYFYNKRGGYTQVDYLTSSRYKNALNKLLNPKLPFLLPLAQKISDYDGISLDAISSSYEYESGEFYYKNPFDRRFAGFKIISEKNTAGYIAKSYYHQGNSSEAALGEWDPNNNQFLDGVPKIGKPFRIDQYDANNNLYKKTFQRWQSTALGNERDFVRLAQAVESDYDGNNTKKSQAEQYNYDTNNGNLLQEILMGEVQVSDDALKQGSITSDLGTDKLTIDISYTKDATKKITLPASEIIKDQNSNKISETQIFYDNLPLFSATKGNITKQSFWISGNQYANNTANYNSYGLPINKTDALGNTTTYTYDAYNLYPSKITNALNQSHSYTYDYSSGGIKQYTDPNGLKFENIYDIFDRIKEEKQPDPTNPATSITKTVYDYYDNVFPSYISKWDKVNSQWGPVIYSYFDGLGRIIQARQEIEDPGIFSVKDFKYNNMGLIDKESLPYIGSGGSKTLATVNDNLYIKYKYDALGRPTTIQNALGATTYSYDDWKTAIKDAENNSKDYYNDAYGNLIKVVEYNEGSAYTTNYQYNGLNNLIKITDALGNIRNFSYDGLGRRLTSQDLHATNDATFGTRTYNYDNASNLISETDQNGQIINYSYDKLNRPTLENYTGQNGNEVAYTYDNCTYGIGRLCQVTNLTNGTNTVITQYGYTPLGFSSSEKRTIDGKDYLTQFSYDYLGNPLSITYPDGSVVGYTNNMEGKIKSVKHQNNNIIKNITYTATGAPETTENANGTIEKNTFDQSKLYRLTNKSTTSAQSIQNISYTYDKVGNVKQIIDSSKKPDSTPSAIAKNATYQYDNLYRLKSANITNTGNNQNYSRNYTYNSIGNILSKTGQGNYSYAGNQGTSYATPHAVTAIGAANFSYDKNGNLLSDGKQTYKWDYKNRLIEGSATGLATKYLYDFSGERVKKSDGKNWTIYVNNFYEIRNDKIVKHIYAGDENLASIEVGSATTPPPPTPTTDEIVYEDAEDGKTLGWKPYNTATSIINTYENEKQGKVIVLKSPLQYNSMNYGGFNLKKEDGTNWDDSTNKIFSFDLNSKNDVQIALNVETSQGNKYLEYHSKIDKSKATGNYIYIKLDNTLLDGNWHTIVRDLQADANSILPGITINKINYLQIWWAGKTDNIKVDNIKLMKSMQGGTPPPLTTDEIVYEDAEDGKTLGWKAYTGGSSANNIYDNEKQSKIITLSPQSMFELKNEDGTLWNNSTHKIFSIDLSTKQDFRLWLPIDTNNGEKVLIYGTDNYLPNFGKYISIGLDSSLKDGKWHTISKDLQADVTKVQPGTTINKINYLQTQWFGQTDNIKVDNIKLIKTLPGSPTPSAASAGTKTIYHHTDHLSGTSIETDENGKVIEMTDYYPFGEIRIDQSLDSNGAATSTGYKNPYKFTGKELDTDIGLYYYGARYYNPTIGRFVSMDPWEGDLKDPQSLNKYSYVLNNPLKYIDPKGLWNKKTGAVEKGDTLSSITKTINKTYKTKYSVKDIAKLNNVKNPNKISIGQIIMPNGTVPDISNALGKEMGKWAKSFRKISIFPLTKRYKFYKFATDPKKGNLKHRKGSIFDVNPVEQGGQGTEGYVFRGEFVRFDAPANILYGYVGKAAGFEDYTLFEYAGKYQVYKGNSTQAWIDDPSLYGDDPFDHAYIQKGIDLYINPQFNQLN